ncbi:Peptide methionine sulfoxide reductase MsrA 2 [Mizuhopecten yessoensis]|uniref:Mitochondrial peptide methionine sulfoxide reductase n=2 Tax=Mizuhopecten yessoensis TaxID=6573 RepID=A0A210PVV6_MIZYE|nr:Peptide methionine sulfoxide reductase MsrA 2 [Mizuhopecten yessoensis]
MLTNALSRSCLLTLALLVSVLLRQVDGRLPDDKTASKMVMPEPEDAITGRSTKMVVSPTHDVSSNPTVPPFPGGMQLAMFGMGCFWGAERRFWKLPGVFSTQVGYANGYTPNPTYEEVCTGGTGHNEVVRVVYNPDQISYADLLQVFWEGHNPTQGMRQGRSLGTQYRSGIYYYDRKQRQEAIQTKEAYGEKLRNNGYEKISTEILSVSEFYYAEDYHQQYLHKNPEGYCGLGGTGVSCPRGLGDKMKSEL